jgi:hypothetical protein
VIGNKVESIRSLDASARLNSSHLAQWSGMTRPCCSPSVGTAVAGERTMMANVGNEICIFGIFC